MSRRFRAYVIGTAKSGTHSLNQIFARHYRVAHEPEYASVIDMVIKAAAGKVSSTTIAEFLRTRDSRLKLELECSHPLFHLLDALLAEFSDAKFILTIRDCYSWLDSQINNQLSYIEPKCWQDFGEFKYGHDNFHYPEEEQILEQFGLYTLSGYLAAWSAHNKKVLETVPRDRLLVVRTQDIQQELSAIADFLGATPKHLNRSGVHEYKGAKKFNLLVKLDPGYLEQKVNEFCRELMDEYFPGTDVWSWRARQLSHTGLMTSTPV